MRSVWLPKLLPFAFLSFAFLLTGCSNSPDNAGTGNGGGTTGNTQPEILYAAYLTPNGGGAGGSIEPMAFNTNNGTLKSLPSVLGPGNAVSIIADPTKKFLYSSDFNTDAVYAYSIDSSSGNLSPVVGSPYTTSFSGNGGPLAIDPAGKFIFFVADPSGDIVTFLRNSSDGTLTLSSAPAAQDQYQPIELIVDPTSKFLFVSNHSDFSNGGQISVYAIDGSTGGLTPVQGSPFAFQGSNTEPWGMALSSTGQYLYSTLSNASAVAAFAVNAGTGTISPITGSPFAAPMIPEQMVLHPSGKFLYISTRGIGSISEFSVNNSTGALTAAGPSLNADTGPLAADPSGKYLFYSQETRGAEGLVVLAVDPSSGTLTSKGTVPSSIGAPTALDVIALP